MLLLADEAGERLFTIAAHGYEGEGIGSEVVIGEGAVGVAAARRAPTRVGNLRQMSKYSESVRRSSRASAPATSCRCPACPRSRAVWRCPRWPWGAWSGSWSWSRPRRRRSPRTTRRCSRSWPRLVAGAVEVERAQEVDGAGDRVPTRRATAPEGAVHQVRFFTVDGSTFLDGEYLIKGVAGRILWALLGHHQRDGRVDFTNREVRLDPSLELPEYRDNLESRLILLKRRLDEREAPVRIEKTGRGRFRLVVDGPLRLAEGAG